MPIQRAPTYKASPGSPMSAASPNAPKPSARQRQRPSPTEDGRNPLRHNR
ncbi:Uncharacterised protein [Mycobacteroides abscessus subsp. abscessus]|nr:Uncharacterised protein [Mycobacteroides abscessus subsp. abscessus]SKS47439.1 Uncharacterised protein [Mycobacteroides abscessus subsp. abscessus]SKT34391.1 Uncharacterised protein [Mycobacteroides abscessus subsp. abscessus]SKU78746.1 Uncharacterised protein [Mycobacteroides abscessus subsp. abscessus]